MRKYVTVLVAVATIISLSGCSNLFNNQNNNSNVQNTPEKSPIVNVEEKKVKLKLYFPTMNNDNIVLEERETEVEEDNELIKVAIEALIEGPESNKLRKPMPEGTKLLGVEKEDNVVVVDFSKEYRNSNDIAELVEWVSVVNTLTELNGVKKVRILVEGEDLIGPSGQPYGELSRVELDNSLISKSGEKKTITLYFSGSQAEFVVPEIREVEVDQGKGIEETIINELIKGPYTEELDSAIPKGTRLITVETKDGVCTLNLSKEFVENSYTGSAGETMTVYSIVNSLTELPSVKKVQFLIEGEKREVYLHMAFDTPIERDEEMIAK